MREREAVSEIDYRSTQIRADRARKELGFEERRFETVLGTVLRGTVDIR